jgi:hypothetical protein
VKYEKQTEEIIRRNMTKPESKIQQHRKTLAATVHKRSLVETELKLQQEIAVQSERLTKAALALKEANLTAEEKRKRDAETGRVQRLLAKTVCPELSPSWREEATAFFHRKR